MAGYKYRGTNFTPPPGDTIEKRMRPVWLFDASKCGTNAGYHQHYRHAQASCDACLNAHHAYDAEYRARQKAAGIKRGKAGANATRMPNKSLGNKEQNCEN